MQTKRISMFREISECRKAGQMAGKEMYEGRVNPSQRCLSSRPTQLFFIWLSFKGQAWA